MTSSRYQKIAWSLLSFVLAIVIFAIFALLYLEINLPEIDSLENIQYQIPLKIYSADHHLIAEYGEKRRHPVAFDQIPKLLIQGLLATEDQRFFEHAGVDLFGLTRAAIQLIKTGTKSQGGSTITMQVARNFFLERRKTYLRKFNEILLAIKIDHYFKKEKILELYLNKIYFGNRSYGVAAAAKNYYGKTLFELTLPEMAMIAGLPQAPSAVNPITNPIAAKTRRNHVLTRMFEEKYINESDYQTALHTSISAQYQAQTIELEAPYVAEFVRKQLLDRLGKKVYTAGYQVYTTINSELQNAANAAVHSELSAYDKRHGYRGPISSLQRKADSDLTQLFDTLNKLQMKQPLGFVAYVAELTSIGAKIILSDKRTSFLTWQNMQWAQKRTPINSLFSDGVPPISVGDIVLVDKNNQNHWELYQTPKVEGALIAMSPHDGAIGAMTGGFAFQKSHFNRTVQAERQPGSCFKPFIYSAALAHGYTLATLINDAPLVESDPYLEEVWRPQNDNRHFSGLTRLRFGLVRSKNLVSIRLLDAVGIQPTLNYLQNFGFDISQFPESLSLALGTVSLTPLDIARAYSIFANGGKRIEPFIIDEIKNFQGDTLFKAVPKLSYSGEADRQAPEAIDSKIAFLINDALQDVIQHGTGRALKVLHRSDLAGKTGTTNNHFDAWFAGYIPNQLVAVTWLGFDQPESLHEYASKTALPMWKNFMKPLLSRYPEVKTEMPPGIVTVKIDPKTGQQASPESNKGVFEVFREEHAPQVELKTDPNLAKEKTTSDPLF